VSDAFSVLSPFAANFRFSRHELGSFVGSGSCGDVGLLEGKGFLTDVLVEDTGSKAGPGSIGIEEVPIGREI
jgi:hypothetical protein